MRDFVNRVGLVLGLFFFDFGCAFFSWVLGVWFFWHLSEPYLECFEVPFPSPPPLHLPPVILLWTNDHRVGISEHTHLLLVYIPKLGTGSRCRR